MLFKLKVSNNLNKIRFYYLTNYMMHYTANHIFLFFIKKIMYDSFFNVFFN